MLRKIALAFLRWYFSRKRSGTSSTKNPVTSSTKNPVTSSTNQNTKRKSKNGYFLVHFGVREHVIEIMENKLGRGVESLGVDNFGNGNPENGFFSFVIGEVKPISEACLDYNSEYQRLGESFLNQSAKFKEIVSPSVTQFSEEITTFLEQQKHVLIDNMFPWFFHWRQHQDSSGGNFIGAFVTYFETDRVFDFSNPLATGPSTLNHLLTARRTSYDSGGVLSDLQITSHLKHQKTPWPAVSDANLELVDFIRSKDNFLDNKQWLPPYQIGLFGKGQGTWGWVRDSMHGVQFSPLPESTEDVENGGGGNLDFGIDFSGSSIDVSF